MVEYEDLSLSLCLTPSLSSLLLLNISGTTKYRVSEDECPVIDNLSYQCPGVWTDVTFLRPFMSLEYLNFTRR